MNVQTADIEILWLSQSNYYAASRVVPHSHPDYYQIYYIHDGQGTFSLNSQDIPFVAGMYFLIHPGEVHGMSGFVPASGETVPVYELKFFVHDQELTEELGRIREPLVGTPALSEEFIRIFREAVSKDFYYEKRLPHLLTAWMYSFINICKNYGYSTADSAVVPNSPAARIRDYLEQHYMEDISLDQIAEDMDYSKNYLCRLFKEGTDTTITDYLTNVRISHAKELLLKMRYSVTDVSQMCGFHSVNYFNKVFKDIVGLPPGAFRRSELAGYGNLEGPIIAVNTAVNTRTIYTYPRVDTEPQA